QAANVQAADVQAADVQAADVQAADVQAADVIVGSRYVPGGKVEGWPLRRRFMSRLVNRFAVTCLRLPVNDCSGSMRCYRVSMLRRLPLDRLRSNGYAFLEELLVYLDHAGARMIEYPITFTDRQTGDSKLTLRETIRAAWFLLGLSFTRPR
ncbi:MAG: polyprenol monophosphomannose synthase, partial [Planctomycetota bacterium]